jgi:N-acetylneuraminate synthase
MMLKSRKTLIISESGVNHNGSLEEAKRLVDAAKDAAVDIVKFQTFKAENIVTKNAAKAEYQVRETGSQESQYDMLKKLELSFDDFLELADYCDKKKIEFLSTAFDEECLDFLVRKTGIKRIKIPSGELTNGPLIAAAARTGLPLIISSGMATIAEVEEALDVIAWAKYGSEGKHLGSFRERGISGADVTVLHCTTEYPAPLAELNLRALNEISKLFNLPVGYSDHSEGILAPVASVAMGAVVVEKHFTLSRNLPGPDHKASLEPAELNEMVRQIRLVESMLGGGFKEPSAKELENAKVARKSLVASKAIGLGEVISGRNLSVKRPGTGISPMRFWELLGKKATRSYLTDELIAEDLAR